MKILVWIEPVFIRGSMVTYEWIAARFIQALKIAVSNEPDFLNHTRIFCNRATLDRIHPNDCSVSKCLLTSTDQEEVHLHESLVPWADEGIQRWIAHMKGDAEYSNGYIKMLERVREEFAFDVIVVWGTNGIVNRYARATGVLPLFLELGPIRLPFVATGVIDSRGVNGDSRIAVGDFGWDAVQDRQEPTPLNANLLAGRWDAAPSGLLPENYVVVPLQTADDANVLVHNNGKSYDTSIYEAVGKISASGKTSVVKTHPGARHSPFNAACQERLLRMLAGIPRVIVLDHVMEGSEYSRLLLNADAVATFNSSLGFEASLLGVKTHVMAPAGYAPPGSFAEMNEVCGGAPNGELWLSRMEKLHRLMIERYLLHIDDVFNFQILQDVACFWKDKEHLALRRSNSIDMRSVATMQVIKRIFSGRPSVLPSKASKRLSPLGIRWPEPS